MSGRGRAVAGLALLGLLLGGCGVPTSGAPRTIAPSDVPYGLASPTASAPAEQLSEPVLDPSRIFLVDETDTLVARGRDVTGSGARERLSDLLADLAAGPTGGELDQQLSTALPPDVELTVREVTGGTAAIELAGPVDAPSGWASRRAVAQVVLTATSLPGIDAVRLTIAGEPVEAPLPSGELTSEPLTAEDYAEFLVPATEVASVAPAPAATATAEGTPP